MARWELVTNGGLNSDSNWTKGDGWEISPSQSKANWREAEGSGTLSQSIRVFKGHKYTVIFTTSGIEDGGEITVSVGGTSGTKRTTAATFTESITAVSSDNLIFTPSSSGTAAKISVDSISVKDTIDDQLSINGVHLASGRGI